MGNWVPKVGDVVAWTPARRPPGSGTAFNLDNWTPMVGQISTSRRVKHGGASWYKIEVFFPRSINTCPLHSLMPQIATQALGRDWCRHAIPRSELTLIPLDSAPDIERFLNA